jgi:methylase of polypeptide subunit release factors
MGIDISSKALSLARKNLDHNMQQGLLTHRASTDIQFHRADVLGLPTGGGGGDGAVGIPNVEKILSEYFDQPGETETSEDSPLNLEPGCDLLISNPPYISTSDFRNGTTARSVRLFEPKLALVPPPQSPPPQAAIGDVRPEDIFYRRILELSYKLRTKVTVLECGDIKQAERVIKMHTFLAPERDRFQDQFDVQVWPNTEQDMTFYGFHHNDGSRCVIIQRGVRSNDSSK